MKTADPSIKEEAALPEDEYRIDMYGAEPDSKLHEVLNAGNFSLEEKLLYRAHYDKVKFYMTIYQDAISSRYLNGAKVSERKEHDTMVNNFCLSDFWNCTEITSEGAAPFLEL